MKPTKCPAKRKKKQVRKEKEEGRRESEKKKKMKTAVLLLNLKTKVKILLSGHTWTLETNILHLDQKTAKVRPVNCFVVSFISL